MNPKDQQLNNQLDNQNSNQPNMSQPTNQLQDNPLQDNKPQDNKPQLDHNWQDDALDISLGYDEATLAIRAGYHRTDEGEHSEAIFCHQLLCL